ETGDSSTFPDSLELHRLPEVPGPGAEDMDVEDAGHPAHHFPGPGLEAAGQADVASVESDQVDAVSLADEDGALVVEALAHHDAGGLAEDLLEAHHGIQGPEAGVVADDAFLRNTAGDEV